MLESYRGPPYCRPQELPFILFSLFAQVMSIIEHKDQASFLISLLICCYLRWMITIFWGCLRCKWNNIQNSSHGAYIKYVPQNLLHSSPLIPTVCLQLMEQILLLLLPDTMWISWNLWFVTATGAQPVTGLFLPKMSKKFYHS